MDFSSRLTVAEYYDINDKISDAAGFGDISHKILAPLSQLVGAETSVFGLLKKTGHGLHVDNVITNGVDNKSSLSYEKYFQNADPVLPYAFNSTQLNHKLDGSKGFTFILDNIVDTREFSRCSYFNEFLRPNSITQIMAMGIPSSMDSSLVYVIGFHRYCNYPFREKDIQTSSYLGPTLFNVLNGLDLKSRLNDRNIIVSQLQNQLSDTGLVIVDKNYTVIFASQTGKKHLNIRSSRKNHSLNLERNLITELHSRLSVTGTASSGEMEFNYDGTRITLRVIASDPNNPDKRIILHTKRTFCKSINTMEMDKYDLTQREAVVASLIVMGLTSPQISDKLCISTRTVENHLRSIYAKANVKNRTSLAYKLAPTRH